MAIVAQVSVAHGPFVVNFDFFLFSLVIVWSYELAFFLNNLSVEFSFLICDVCAGLNVDVAFVNLNFIKTWRKDVIFWKARIAW